MKYLVVSDIHGSVSGAKLMEKKLASGDFVACLCLGDILYHGPRNDLPQDYSPKEVIDILNTVKDKVIAVRGNCDSEVDQMVLDFPMMSDENQFYMGYKKVVMTHGHLEVKFSSEMIVLSGHTHIPTAKKEDGITKCNPGSLSMPKGGYEKSYGVLSEDSFEVFDTFDVKIMGIDY